MEPLALGIWTERATAVGTFLPLKTEPAQVFGHRRDKILLPARAVEVFVAEHERAGEFFRALLGNPKSARMTEVQIAGRRWRETAAIGRCYGNSFGGLGYGLIRN